MTHAVIVHISADVPAKALVSLLGFLSQLLATPLVVTNIAALAVILTNLANLEFAAPFAFLALGMLLLILLVSESEAHDEESVRHG